MFTKNDIDVLDYREVDFANVIFDKKRLNALNVIRNYLNKMDVLTIGRFGKWEYLWTDQSLLSGKNAVEKIE
jgi:hypothetical protein